MESDISLDVRKEKLLVGLIFAKKPVDEWGDVEIRVCSRLFLRERRSGKEKLPINDKGQQIEQRYVYFFHVKLLIMAKM